VELGAAYSDAGADELVFLDVAATVGGRAAAVGVARRVAGELAIPFTVGGGVRSADDASELLEAGADKVSVNSAALARPRLVGELAERLGSQAVVVAVDTDRGEVRSHAGTRGTSRRLVEWAVECEERGAGELLVTSIDRDGTRSGYDLDALRAVAAAVSIPVVASGGAGGAEDVARALGVAQAALLASILHERPDRLRELRAELAALGVPLRDAA
jgi:cyclase